MSGKQVYVTEERHRKLKLASLNRDEDMGEIVGEFIDSMEVKGWNEIKEDEFSY